MKDILELAKEVRATIYPTFNGVTIVSFNLRELEAFANLIEAKARDDEREQCAKICEECGYDSIKGAEDIRARGE